MGNIYIDEKFIPITNDIVPGIYDWYLISNYGKVYNKYTGKLLHNYEYGKNNSGNGYYVVNLSTIYGNKSYSVHRLVIDSFYPINYNINKPLDVNHKNGNKKDNYISYNDINRGNLERCTRQENIQHAYNSGLHHLGEDNIHSKISNETAMKIIKLLSFGKYTSKEIVDIVGNNVSVSIVDSIRKKESWKNLSSEYTFYQRPNRLFSEIDIHNFCKSFQNHKNDNLGINENSKLALIENGFDIDKRNIETLRKIYTKKYYKNIVSQYNW